MGQVGRHPLVQVDQLVELARRQSLRPRGPRDELRSAGPTPAGCVTMKPSMSIGCPARNCSGRGCGGQARDRHPRGGRARVRDRRRGVADRVPAGRPRHPAVIVIFGLTAVGILVTWLFATDYATAVAAIAVGAGPGDGAVRLPGLHARPGSGARSASSLLGLRVVTVEGGPIRVRHAAIRAFLQLVDVWLIPIGVVGRPGHAASPHDQRLGDLAAGHASCSGSSSRRCGRCQCAFLPAAGPVRPYAATLDVDARSRPSSTGAPVLPHAGPPADPGRQGVARRPAGPTGGVARWTTPVPSWLHPELFLVCVAAAYQRRPPARS